MWGTGTNLDPQDPFSCGDAQNLNDLPQIDSLSDQNLIRICTGFLELSCTGRANKKYPLKSVADNSSMV